MTEQDHQYGQHDEHRHSPGTTIPLDVLDTLAAYPGVEPDWREAYREAYRRVREIEARCAELTVERKRLDEENEELVQLRKDVKLARQYGDEAMAKAGRNPVDLYAAIVEKIAEATGDSAAIDLCIMHSLPPNGDPVTRVEWRATMRHGHITTRIAGSLHGLLESLAREYGHQFPDLRDLPMTALPYIPSAHEMRRVLADCLPLLDAVVAGAEDEDPSDPDTDGPVIDARQAEQLAKRVRELLGAK